MARDQFAEDVAEVGGDGEIALVVQLVGFEARPIAVDLAPLDAAAEGEHHVGVTMVGTARAVFLGRAAEFAHRDNGDVFDARTQVAIKGRERCAELAKQVLQLRGLIRVGVPSAHVGESSLESNVALDQAGDLFEALGEWRLRILGPIGRCVGRPCESNREA